MNYEDDARLWMVIPIYQLCYTGDIKTSKLGLNLKEEISENVITTSH